MHSAMAATILIASLLLASPTLARTQTHSSATDQEPIARARASQAAPPNNRASGKRRRFRRDNHSPVIRKPVALPLAPPAVSLVSRPPEYLSGEANVTVKGNENPIIRLGLATSGVALVEFPASDRFFALHPGNSEMVTIDESPTKQNDHFFVFRAGRGFVLPPASPSSTGPAASIIAQMRSGMVVTFLIYPVRELLKMAHRVVILYDRAEVVAARRAAGLAVNLEERGQERKERSIRIAPEADRSSASTDSESGDDNPDVQPRTSEVRRTTGEPDDNNSTGKAPSGNASQSSSSRSWTLRPDRDFTIDARRALKLALTSSKLKNWTRPLHGLSIATSVPKDFNDKDGSAIVIVAVSNTLAEPLRIVPGQPDLAIETRDDQSKKTLLVEQIKKLHVESSALGDSIPAASTIYFAIVYHRPVLGVRQHIRVTVAQINAADDPAAADLTTFTR